VLEKTSSTTIRESVGYYISLVFISWRILEAFIFISLLYLGGIINHTDYSFISVPDLLYFV